MQKLNKTTLATVAWLHHLEKKYVYEYKKMPKTRKKKHKKMHKNNKEKLRQPGLLL